MLLDVLVLNSEHGSGHVVDGCRQAVDVVVVACEEAEKSSGKAEWKRLLRGCFSCLRKKTQQSKVKFKSNVAIVNRDGQTPAATLIAISAICSKCCNPDSKPSSRGRRGHMPRLTVRMRVTQSYLQTKVSHYRRNFHQTASIKRESLMHEI